MSAREEILARLRGALDGAAEAPAPPRPVVDARAQGDPELMAGRLRDYKAVVHRAGPGELAAVLGGVLAGVGVLAVPPDLPEAWLSAHSGRVLRDPDVAALDTVDAVLTGAAVAVAETGTIVLDAGPAQGRRALTLVPDRHVCVLFTRQIAPGVAQALARLRPTAPLTWISGPSATSDIELSRVEGVHGPRRLDVVIAEY
ncbi:hypothetical protein Afil01_45710 [Actinorhabdospora filicis]|uniref:LUD domain-containing protein n=1 Tax=Actinorhabdospora filicis TaxID=1785913 RepID=A0A9W6SPR2_9ACTN|nr:LUD domain-containing protein [Actinorhabdospora filicis]GLZ79764.1 hypothetical protein Afil01_45710 [Actinorhabdospora filicis]